MDPIKIVLNQFSDSAVQLENENFNIIIDRPKGKGGNGEGLMGGQYLLAGVGGCFCSTLFASAASRNIRIKGLRTEVTAILDLNPKRFKSISLNVSYTFCSKPEEFNKLIKIAENGCISINTLKNDITFSCTLN